MAITTSFIKVLRRPFESALNTAIAVVDKTTTLNGSVIVQGLFQGVEDEARMRAQTDNPAGVGIDQ